MDRLISVLKVGKEVANSDVLSWGGIEEVDGVMEKEAPGWMVDSELLFFLVSFNSLRFFFFKFSFPLREDYGEFPDASHRI